MYPLHLGVHVETDAVYEDYQFFGVASKYSVDEFIQDKKPLIPKSKPKY